MGKKITITPRVDDQEYYSIPELVAQDWFPVKSVITLRKMIDRGEIRAIALSQTNRGTGKRVWRKIHRNDVRAYLSKITK